MCSNNSINEDYFEQQQHQQTLSSTTKKTSSVCISSTSSISETSAVRIMNDDEQRRISSPDQFEAEKRLLEQFQAMSTATTCSTSSAIVKQSNSLDVTSTENIADLLPPALPPKVSRITKVSSYESDTTDK